MIEEQTGDTPAPDASPPPPRTRPLRAYLLIAAAAVGVVAISAGVWFAWPLLFPRQITITFLDSSGKEIGRRGPAAINAAAPVVVTHASSGGHDSHAASPAPVHRKSKDSVNYYLDWAYEEAQELAQHFSGKEFVAVTALDASMQRTAETLITETLFHEGVRFKVRQAALVAMSPDGAVHAMVGGRNYAHSSINWATVRREPGSSFTPYVYLLALLGGADPNERVTDTVPPCENLTAEDYSGGQRRPMTLTKALAWSVNSTPVQLSLNPRYGGREKFLELLGKIGFDGLKPTCSIALGDQGVTPLSHVSAYAVFANGGRKVQAYAVLELRNHQGHVIYRRRNVPSPQIVRRASVEPLNRMLHYVVRAGSGRMAALDFAPAAGKTGTSTDYRDAWFIGYTGRLVTGVWMGNDDGSSTDRLTGGTLPVQIWKQFNISAHKEGSIPPIPGIETEEASRAEAKH